MLTVPKHATQLYKVNTTQHTSPKSQHLLPSIELCSVWRHNRAQAAGQQQRMHTAHRMHRSACTQRSAAAVLQRACTQAQQHAGALPCIRQFIGTSASGQLRSSMHRQQSATAWLLQPGRYSLVATAWSLQPGHRSGVLQQLSTVHCTVATAATAAAVPRQPIPAIHATGGRGWDAKSSQVCPWQAADVRLQVHIAHPRV